MIPQSNLMAQMVVSEDLGPSKTYKWDMNTNKILGFTDGREAIEQMIYKTLNTERYTYLIYSFNYGVELENLVGQDIDMVKADIKHRIEEALKQDDRIERIDNFSVEGNEKDYIAIKFDVVTKLGVISIAREVGV